MAATYDRTHAAADGIACFYRKALRATVAIEQRGGDAVACVDAGRAQKLLFRETGGVLPPYDGRHIQIYIADFSGPHHFLAGRA